MSSPSISTPERNLFARLGLYLIQFVALAGPVLFMAKAVRQFRYNTLFLDDWVYVPLYEKAVKGGLTLHDFFAGYLEHRIPIPKLIAILGAVLTKGDVTTQNWVGFASLVGAWLIVGRLLWRALGSWDKTWLPWALCGGALCSTVHWQELLWPAMHLLTLPGLFLALALLFLGSRKLGFWPRFILTFLMEVCAFLSCAAGLALAGLIPLAVLCGYGMKDSKMMRRFLLLLTAGTGIVLFLYFHNLKSEVDPAFAYGQENGANTLSHSLKSLAADPMKGLPYWPSLLGSNLSRGINEDRKSVSLTAGSALLVVFAGLGIWAWRNRKSSIFNRSIPFLVLGGYAIGAAFLITLGRAWASNGFGGSLNNRYSGITAMLVVAVIGLSAIVLNSWTAEGRERKRARFIFHASGGFLATILWINSVHGVHLMESWQAGRLRSAVDLHFSQVLGLSGHHGSPGARLQISVALPYGKTLNDLGFIARPLATDTNLSQFKSAGMMPKSLARVDSQVESRKQITVSGCALLRSAGRPPDGILVTSHPLEKDDSGTRPEKRIIDVGYVDQLPTWIDSNTTKDFHFILQGAGNDTFRTQRHGGWQITLDKKDLLPGRQRLDFYALDFLNGTVAKIDGGFLVENRSTSSAFTKFFSE